jgi:dephospho-CoA kinase
MLRVGLTGGLGSGKSTVAAMLREHGAYVLSADDIGRRLMEPGQAVYAAIVQQFGASVVRADGALDRPALARIAFGEGRIEKLNAIVHPATIQLQTEMAADIFRQDPAAVVVVESALIFETKFGDGWRERFDRMVLVTAPEELKIARFVERSGGGDRAALEAEARRRLAQMIPDRVKAPQCDSILRNDRTLEELRRQVDELWTRLEGERRKQIPAE